MQSNFITMLEISAVPQLSFLRAPVSSLFAVAALRKVKIRGGDSVTTSVHAMNLHGT